MKNISDSTFIFFYILFISLLTFIISPESEIDSNNIKNLNEMSSEISQENVLERKYPLFCFSSSSLDEVSTCENLYDSGISTWKDNNMGCEDAWIEFTFSQEIYLEFIVFQNPEIYEYFVKTYNARDILITNSDLGYSLNKEMQNENISQWIDINAMTSDVYIQILSAYPGEEINGIQPFSECAIQEITFYGRDA